MESGKCVSLFAPSDFCKFTILRKLRHDQLVTTSQRQIWRPEVCLVVVWHTHAVRDVVLQTDRCVQQVREINLSIIGHYVAFWFARTIISSPRSIVRLVNN